MIITPKTITVITPVYNMAKYLDLCITSILKQTYKDFILLLIDDGSTDDSGEICDKYAAMDDRIKVIHTPNQGQGEARNTALRNVETDYIAMIDSDDCVNVRFLEILMKTMEETDADMVVGRFFDFVDEKEISIDKIIDYAPEDIEILSRDESIEQLCEHYSAGIVTPQKLYKTSLFDGIWYPEIGVNIDEWVIHHLFIKIDRFAIVNRQLYYYRMSAEGMTRNFSLKKVSGLNAVVDRIKTLENTKYSCYLPALYARLYSNTKAFFRKMREYNLDGLYLLKPLKPELKKAYYKYICKRTDLYCKKEMLAQWLFCHSFSLYEGYCKLMKYNFDN